MGKKTHFNIIPVLRKDWLCLIVALLPLFYLVYFSYMYSVDIPIWDDWELIPLIEKSFQSKLTINDLLGTHNQVHRHFFPRLIILASVHLTGWNSIYQVFFNIFLGVSIFIILSIQLKETEKNISRGSACWIISVFGIIIFSLSQWENWFWGWQICIFLNVFSVVTGIFLLSSQRFCWLRLVLAACLGIIATYSFANGLIFWPIGLLMISVSGWSKLSKRLSVGLWAVISFSVIYLYFYYPSPLPQGDLRWQDNLVFIFQYLGSPLIQYGPPDYIVRRIALYSGVFSVICAVASSFLLIRYCRIRFKVIAPWIALILYSGGSAVITSLGRDINQVLASRYVTISSLLWLANIVLLYVLVQNLDPILKSRAKVNTVKRIVWLIVLFIVIMVVHNSIRSAQTFLGRSRDLQRVRDRLRRLNNEDEFLLGPGVTAQRLNILKKYHLVIFRE
jgi:hypothetical protein